MSNAAPPEKTEPYVRTLVIFRIGGAWLALPAEFVEEICDLTTTMPLPRAPAHILGLMNLRGHAVPTVNLQVFLNLPPSSGGPSRRDEFIRPRVLLVSWGGMRVGLMCDHVRGLVPAPQAALRPLGGVVEGLLANYSESELCLADVLAPVLDLPVLLEAARVRR